MRERQKTIQTQPFSMTKRLLNIDRLILDILLEMKVVAPNFVTFLCNAHRISVTGYNSHTIPECSAW